MFVSSAEPGAFIVGFNLHQPTLVNRWMTRPSGVVSKKARRVDSVALNNERCRVLAAAKLAIAHAKVRAQLTAAWPMPMPA